VAGEVSAYMNFYPRDYLAGVAHMGPEDRGNYSTLLFAMWDRGGWLVLDADALARLCGTSRKAFDASWQRIKEKFRVNPDVGTFTHDRLQEEWRKATERRRRATDNGTRGGRPKSPKPQEQANLDNLQVISGLPKQEPKRKLDIQVPGFSLANPGESSSSAICQGQRSDSGSFATGAKPSRTKPPQDKRVGEIYGLFRPRWRAMYGDGWAPEPGLSNNVTQMLAALDQASPVETAEIDEWLARFFADSDQFLVDARHSLRLFCASFNKWRVEPGAIVRRGGGLSERDKRNAEALAAFGRSLGVAK